MFQTRIASDAVAHQTELGDRWVFSPTPAGGLWFTPLAQLRLPVQYDRPSCLKTSLLIVTTYLAGASLNDARVGMMSQTHLDHEAPDDIRRRSTKQLRPDH